MSDDAELLRCYAESGSETAFAEFVGRHVGLVYAAARRRTGDDARAREAAQLVFTDAARRAGTLARHASVGGWLYTATRNATLNLLRAERRRRIHERVAHALDTMNHADAPNWESLRPVLDAAMDDLNRSDRDAVIERFFENQPYSEIGVRLRVSENAARMRVERALERLRGALARRGVTSTDAALATVLADQALAAPVGLATGIAHVAVTANVGGAAAAGWLGFFAMNKVTTAIVTIVLVGALVPPALELRARYAMSTELDRLRQQRADVRGETPEVEAAFRRIAPSTPDQPSRDELTRLQQRAAVLKARPDGVVEAQLRAPRNAGTATPEATFETINWAINTQDWETFSRLFVLEGETREKADAFFAGVRPDIRERYGTAERLLAHAWVTGTNPHGSAWMAGMQVLDSQPADGAPLARRVKIWQRTGTGVEVANVAEFQYRPAVGWILSPGATAKALGFMIPLLDAQTGAIVRRPPVSP